MLEFQNVTVVKKANVYFGGSVTSRTVLFADGTKKTLGIMNVGDYEFAQFGGKLIHLGSGQALQVSRSVNSFEKAHLILVVAFGDEVGQGP